MMSPTGQFQSLNILESLSDLFSAAGKNTFTCGEVLLVRDAIRSDPEIFDLDVVVAQQVATANIDSAFQLA